MTYTIDFDRGKYDALARASRNCKWQTRPLVGEGAPHEHTRNCLTVTKIWSWAPDAA
jgi:hypothetical protein